MYILILIITICTYLLVGYASANALAAAYEKAQWWRLYLVILGWPFHLLWAVLGMAITVGMWTHGKMFPKEEQ